MGLNHRPWTYLAALGLTAAFFGVAVACNRWQWGTMTGLVTNLAAAPLSAIIVFLFLEKRLEQARMLEGVRRRNLRYERFLKVIEVRAGRRRGEDDKIVVRILVTFTYFMTADASFRDLRRRFVRALSGLEAQDTVEILVIDPDSAAARQRAADRPEERVIDMIRRNLWELDDFTAGRGNFQTRVYSQLPSIAIFQSGRDIMMVFLRKGRSITDSPAFSLQVKSELGAFVTEAFDEIWQHARPLGELMSVEHCEISVDGTNWKLAPEGIRFVDDASGTRHLLFTMDHLATVGDDLRNAVELRIACDAASSARGRYRCRGIDPTSPTGQEILKGAVIKYGEEYRPKVHHILRVDAWG